MRKERKKGLMNLKSISLTLIITAMMTTLVIGTSAQSTAKSDQDKSRERPAKRKLPGTWNVTLRFPVCSASCPCPGGVPNNPIPTLNTYLKDGTMLAALGGSLFSGPGLGSWERIDPSHGPEQGSWEHIDLHQFNARFKFFLFTPTGARRGSEEVSKNILLTSSDTFEATSTFDVFDTAGNITAQGCIINETAKRFE